MQNTELKKCLCCGSLNLKIVLDLDEQPLANMYFSQPSNNRKKFPLCLNRCEECWHSQLSFSVDRSEIFDDYAYVSGTSKTLNLFFSWFAASLKKAVGDNKKILEIAANDGSLIRELQSNNFKCLGVDPAKNIVEIAQKNELPLMLGYWPSIAKDIESQFDVIIAMNVFAHVDDPLSFLKGCKEKLASNGVVIIQPSQARMYENGEFDTIYHEHISFFNTRSISVISQRVGLKLLGSALVKIHGDSPVYFLQHVEDDTSTINLNAFKEGEFGLAEDLKAYENRVNLFHDSIYKKFAQTAQSVIDGVKNLVAEYKSAGYKIVFVGAAAKAITVINASNVIPDHLLDESPLKIGLYAPGCELIVEPLTSIIGWDQPTLFILSAWNFRMELVAKLKKIGVPNGSKFYTYFPQSQWIDS